MGRGAWRATAHGVRKSRTRLSSTAAHHSSSTSPGDAPVIAATVKGRTTGVSFLHPSALLMQPIRHSEPDFEVQLVMQRRVFTRNTWITIYASLGSQGGPAAWVLQPDPMRSHGCCPLSKPVLNVFHFLSSQTPQLFNACHLLFNVESVSAALPKT